MAEAQTIRNCRAVVPGQVVERCTIVIQGGCIAAAGAEVEARGEVFDAGGMLAVPGFVDAHVHGAAGHDFNEGSVEAAQAVLRAHARRGTTALLATLYADGVEKMLKAITNLADLPQPEDGAEMVGIYLEGPFLNKARRGAQPEEHIIAPDLALFAEMVEAGKGKVRVIAVAPELPGALELIAAARERGIRASMAHSDATYAQVKEAVAAGLSQVTHLFDGMRGVHHREPGAAGAGLLLEALDVELIADGIHVLPEVAAMSIRLKGTERVMPISDALALAGLPPGRYEFAGQPAEVGDGWARLIEPGTPVSVCTMDRAFRNLAAWTALPLPQVAAMTSLNAARAAGVSSRKGSLEAGKDADVVLLREDLGLEAVYLRGRRLA